MKLNTENLEKIINTSFRPKVNVDGGDIKFESHCENTVTIGAYGNCATCPKLSDGCLKWWIEKELSLQFVQQIIVVFEKHIPYYCL